MLLGLDSTDSVEGGCTTHALLEVWASLSRFASRGPPRLVRLNPNVPYKTRGNGALAIELGHGRGRSRVAGVVRGKELLAYESIEEPSSAEAEAIFQTAVESIARLRSETSNTGVAVLTEKPPTAFYEKAVKDHVGIDEIPAVAGSARTHGWGSARGLVGAFAAAAWPANEGTFEAIAYRDPSRWGTPRGLSEDVGARLDQRFLTTFDNWDPDHDHLRIAPRSPCPILAGIRGTHADEAVRALDELGPEPAESWLLFATNQATGDHLRPLAGPSVSPYSSPVLSVLAVDEPESRRGGHVYLPVEAQGVRLGAWAFEPTKEFREVVRSVRPGDALVLEGGVHEDPGTVALEALSFASAAPRRRLTAPECSACRIAMKSQGRRGGFSCPRCGSSAPGELEEAVGPGLGVRHTVPISVRRHLSRPNGVVPVPLSWP